MKQKLFTFVKRIGIAFAITSVLFIITFGIVFQFYIKPNLNNYKSKIELLVSQATGQIIKINSLEGQWDFIYPEIALHEVVFYDSQNNKTLTLEEVSADISWLSPFYLSLTLSEIRLRMPKLLVKRDSNNKIFIGGIPIDSSSNTQLMNWILNQKKISIVQGEINWYDEFRKAPILTLKDLNFSYKTSLFNMELTGKHKFNLNFRVANSDNQLINLSGKIYAEKIENINLWDSEVKIKASNINLASYTPWVNYPIKINSGTGDLNLTANINNASITKIKASVRLTSFKTELNQANKNELNLQNFSSNIIWLSDKKDHQIKFERLYLLTNNGINLEDTASSIIISKETNKPTAFSLRANKIPLDAANEVLQTIPYFEDIKNKVNQIQPSGTVFDIDLKWKEREKTELTLNAKFDKLSMKTFEDFPGYENLTGSIQIANENGSIKFKSTDIAVTYPKLFREKLKFNVLQGNVNWQKDYFSLKNINFSNAFINGSINGNINFLTQSPFLDIQASIPFIDLKHAKNYYPKTISSEHLHWLDTSLLDGRLENTSILIKGSVADFPFVDIYNKSDPSKGTFVVTSSGKDTLIEYGTGWPVVEKFDFNATINAGTFELISKKGQLLGNSIKELKTRIPAITIEHPILNIQGIFNSPLRDAIKFINSSPVKNSVQHVFDEASGSGEGKVMVNIDIPMDNLDAISFKGYYQFLDSTLTNPSLGIPSIEKIKGSITFDEKKVSSENLAGTMFGGNTSIALSADQSKVIKVKLNGKFTDKGIQEKIGSSFSKINGSAQWDGLVEYKEPFLNIQLSSDLRGIEFGYPAPFNKTKEKEEKLYFSKKQNTSKSDDIEFKYSNIVNGKISRIIKNNMMVVDKGYISINSSPVSNIRNQNGLYLNANLPYINLDDFIAIFSSENSNNEFKIDKADIILKSADFFNRKFHDVKIEILPIKGSAKLKLSSKEISGNLLWIEKEDKLVARLNEFNLPDEIKKAPQIQIGKKQKIPNLDIKIGSFQMENKKIGKLEFISNTEKQNIRIQKFKISNEKSIFQADGEWLDWNNNSKTDINFTWKTINLGETLEKVGYNNLIKEGDAEISGQFKWNNNPINFDKTKIDGSFTIDIRKGTILKVEPGVGRFFGLVTLQNLPRRLSLDFRDLFGSGFIFDTINASVRMNNGIMRTNNFRMNGPAAEVNMSGESNIIKETQDLNVKVTPHISDSFSIAALAGGPLVGAAAFLAQKILKDPLNKILTSEYRIIGSWDNPEEVNNSPSDKVKTTIGNTKNLFFENK